MYVIVQYVSLFLLLSILWFLRQGFKTKLSVTDLISLWTKLKDSDWLFRQYYLA